MYKKRGSDKWSDNTDKTVQRRNSSEADTLVVGTDIF